jgi:GNAT superfamily N-acetyltransferase
MVASVSLPEIVAASSLADERLLEIFNRVYSDYFVHVALDHPAWRAMLSRFDLDLEASRVARDGSGIALLGLRGPRGWVGGMGVDPEARRRGAGRALMAALIEQARARAVSRLGLEVLEQNALAIALYESLGFRHVRMLEVWLLETPLASSLHAHEIGADDALAWIARHRRDPEPWQRASESVVRFATPEHPLRGFEVRERGERLGAAVALVLPARASLLQMALAGEPAEELARTLCVGARGGLAALRFLNVPSGHAAARVLQAAGAKLEARQHEMALDLS